LVATPADQAAMASPVGSTAERTWPARGVRRLIAAALIVEALLTLAGGLSFAVLVNLLRSLGELRLLRSADLVVGWPALLAAALCLLVFVPAAAVAVVTLWRHPRPPSAPRRRVALWVVTCANALALVVSLPDLVQRERPEDTLWALAVVVVTLPLVRGLVPVVRALRS
jgi:hypothetical protein